jgi:hypothetical protein
MMKLKMAVLAACTVIAFLCLIRAAGGHHSADHNELLSWIPPSCCVTNDCCFPVEPGTVEAVDQNNYRVIASGQIIPRTGWSMNGRFMRCACDFIDGAWKVHPKAFTRCIYPPLPSS